MTETYTLIKNSCKEGVLRLYDDDATDMIIILHPTTNQFGNEWAHSTQQGHPY